MSSSSKPIHLHPSLHFDPLFRESTRTRLLSPLAKAALETDPHSVYAKGLARGVWSPSSTTSTVSGPVFSGRRSRATMEGSTSPSATKAALIAVKTGLAKPALEVLHPVREKKPRCLTFADMTGFKDLATISFLQTVIPERRSQAAFRLLWKAHGKEILARHQARVESNTILSRLAPLIGIYLATVRSGLRPSVEQYFRIEKTPKMGYGLFIRSDKKGDTSILLPKGAVIGEYTGVLRHLSAEREEDFMDNGYLFGLNNDAALAGWIIDAAEEGNYFRFANHSPIKGKAHNIEPVFWVDEEGPHIIFCMVQDGRSGDELRFPYGDSYSWDTLGIAPVKV